MPLPAAPHRFTGYNMLKKPLPLAALLILTNALYLWMASRTLPTLQVFAGGLPPLDVLPFGYAPDYPARLFAALGEAGRAYYRAPQLILDSLYPLLFALTYANLLAVLLRKNFRPQRWFALLCALPVCSAVCDWLENAATFTMLRQYPDITPALAGAGSIFGVIKPLTGFLTLAGILLLILRWLWRYYQVRRG